MNKKKLLEDLIEIRELLKEIEDLIDELIDDDERINRECKSLVRELFGEENE